LGNATLPSHTVVVADVGKAITCTVTASNAGGGASATSAPVIGRALVQCVVPAVARATLKVAKARLAAAHCGLGKVTKARSRTIAKGRVIRAKVAVRSRHAAGYRVALVVSRGR
jgi:beta-lactam-binding protein with PASTA domain